MQHHRTSSSDLRFRDAFESGEIGPEDFTHREHLRLAYVNLCELSLDAAVERVRTGITQLLTRNHLGTGKYHETLTVSWLKAVSYFMQRSGQNFTSAGEFMENSPVLLQSDVMLTHYSRERLFSDEARILFLEPDLEPIPTG